MSTFEILSTTQKVRAAVYRDVRSICSETCHFLGLEITKPAMDIISELLYKKLEVYASDLEAFAKHAKRTIVNSEDVKLLVRRNPTLKSHLNSIQTSTKQQAPKDKRRKTVTLPVSKEPETPKPIPKPADQEKEKIESSKVDSVEEMDISDTIDLTFD